MKGILNNEFNLLDVDLTEIEDGKVTIDESNIFTFKFGEEVEVLKVIRDKSFIGGVAYVILNRNNDSMTVSSILVDLISE